MKRQPASWPLTHRGTGRLKTRSPDPSVPCGFGSISGYGGHGHVRITAVVQVLGYLMEAPASWHWLQSVWTVKQTNRTALLCRSTHRTLLDVQQFVQRVGRFCRFLREPVFTISSVHCGTDHAQRHLGSPPPTQEHHHHRAAIREVEFSPTACSCTREAATAR